MRKYAIIIGLLVLLVPALSLACMPPCSTYAGNELIDPFKPLYGPGSDSYKAKKVDAQVAIVDPLKGFYVTGIITGNKNAAIIQGPGAPKGGYIITVGREVHGAKITGITANTLRYQNVDGVEFTLEFEKE